MEQLVPYDIQFDIHSCTLLPSLCKWVPYLGIYSLRLKWIALSAKQVFGYLLIQIGWVVTSLLAGKIKI